MFFGSLVAFGAEYCVQPIIPLFTDAFGLDPAAASLAVSFGTGGMAFSMLAIACLAGRLPRRKVMAVALIVSALLAVLMAISDSFGLILLLRLCQGILLAGFPAMAIAYINEEFEPSIIGAAIGIYVSGTSVGGLVGRITLSTLTDFFSWRTALLALGIAYVVTGIIFWLSLPKENHILSDDAGPTSIRRDFWRLLHNARLMEVYAVALCVMGAFVCTYNFISYVLLAAPYNLSQTAVGFVYGLYLVGTASSTIMGRLSDRMGNGEVLVLSVALMLVGNLLSLAEWLPPKLIGVGLLTYGFFGAHSAACGWAGRLDSSDKARISALYMFFYYMGGSIVGTLGGKFLTTWGWPGIVAFLTFVLSIALAVSLKLFRAERKISSKKN